MTKGNSKKTSSLKVTKKTSSLKVTKKTSSPPVSNKGKRLRFDSSRSPLTARDRLTKRCSVSLDDAWNEGVIGKRLRNEACVSYRLWIQERDKLEKWRKTSVGKQSAGKNRRSNVKTKESTYCKTKTKTKKDSTKENFRNGVSVKESRNFVLNKRKRKKNDDGKNIRKDDDDSKSSDDSDGGDSVVDLNSSTSEDSAQTDDEDSSDDGLVVDTDNFNQKQARDLVRKIQVGSTKKRLPTRADKLFARWQLAPRLPDVAPQTQGLTCFESPPAIRPERRRKLRVISLFDGISTALVALKSLGLEVEKYVASEVDEDAMKCSKRNHPQIIQVGDVRSITEQHLDDWGPFDLMVGGSPCNDFSRANPHREGFTGKWGKLFFDYARILAICKEKHERADVESPFYWLFENVIMDQEDRNTISYTLGCEPVSIDAMYVSPMRRQRLYWSNIPGLGDPVTPNPKVDRLFLQECLEPRRTARVKRIGCITTRALSMCQGKFLQYPVVFLGKPDKLWSVEIERCFGFPDHYTDVANLSADRRMGLLGMSWSIPCVRHLFQPLTMYFKSSNLISS